MNPPFFPPRSALHVSSMVVFAALALLACPALSNPPTLKNQRPVDRPMAWVPDSSRLIEVADEVALFSPAMFAERAALGQASAGECTLRGEDFACRCVEIETELATYHALDWQRRGDVVEARQLGVRLKSTPNPENWYIGTWHGSQDGEKRSLDKVVLVRALGSYRALEARRIELAKVQSVHIDELRWHRERPGVRETSCGHAWPEALGEPALTASTAGLRRGRWTFRGFGVVGTTVHLSEFEADSPGPVSGFLPPTLIYSDEIASLQAAYLLAEWGVAPQAVVAPTKWYGLGFGLVSHVEDSSAAPPPVGDETSLLDAQLRWSEPAGGVRPAVLGDGFWGTSYVHVATSVEEVGDRRFWAVDRFRRDAPFRAWHLSRAGVSLSGPEHVLSLQVLHAERPNSGELFFGGHDPSMDVLGANFLLATHHELDEHSGADFEVEHTSLVDGDEAAHATTLRAGAERLIGSRGALYAKPALRGWLQTGLASGPDDSGSSGMDTSTRSQLVATLDVAAALRGRFNGVTHRVEPGLVLARELVGFSRGDVVDNHLRAGTFIERDDGFSLAALRLDQGLDVGPQVSVEMPLALVFEGAGVSEAAQTRPWAIGGFAVRGPGSEVGVHTACKRLCDEVFWTASAAKEVGAFDLLYMAGDLRRDVLLALTWRSSVHDGWALIRGFQHEVQGKALDDESAHLAGVGWRRGRLGAKVRGYYRTKHDRFGVSLGNTYAFPELGWTVEARAAVGPGDGDWGLLIGLVALE